jgi:acyl phosphate:glycerol-3-phosphate acyltransferase
LFILVAAAYFIGAVPIGYLVARLNGVDIVRQGSGNIGATNVGRILGWRIGLLVFLLDFAKGALPTWLAVSQDDGTWPTGLAPVAVGLAAFLGHLFPIYLGFRGGKGVATGAGVVAVLVPGPALIALVGWLAVLFAFRFVSLASMLAAILLCAVRLAATPEPFGNNRLIITLFCVLASLLVVVKHRTNIGRLFLGDENRISFGPTMQLISKTLHVMAVGLWFGMAVFFSFPVALSLFGSFETLAQSNERPLWFPLPEVFHSDVAMQKDQGTRAAGFAISPLFDIYFVLQGCCALIATGTALGWTRSGTGRKVHILRSIILIAGLATVVVGWPIERHVSELRVVRNQAADQLLLHRQTAQPVEQFQASWDAAKKEFAGWHVVSLLLNMVTIAMALAAQLPAVERQANTAVPAPAVS